MKTRFVVPSLVLAYFIVPFALACESSSENKIGTFYCRAVSNSSPLPRPGAVLPEGFHDCGTDNNKDCISVPVSSAEDGPDNIRHLIRIKDPQTSTSRDVIVDGLNAVQFKYEIKGNQVVHVRLSIDGRGEENPTRINNKACGAYPFDSPVFISGSRKAKIRCFYVGNAGALLSSPETSVKNSSLE